MEEKGIASKLVKENKVDILQTYVIEDDINLLMQNFKYQQHQFLEKNYKRLMTQEKNIRDLTEVFDDLVQATKHLDRYLNMVKSQCEQINETQTLMLDQGNFNTVSTNFATWRGTETQEP